MYGANLLAATRYGGGGCSSASRISNASCRRSSSSTSRHHNQQHQNRRNTVLAATASAGVACTMCTSLRVTAACSASSSLHLQNRSSSSSSSIIRTTTAAAATYNNNYNKGQPHFGNGMGPLTTTVAAAAALNNNNNNSTIRSRMVGVPPRAYNYHTTTSTTNQVSALPILGSIQQLNGSVKEASSISSEWSLKELAGAVLFATAGSMLLGPTIDRLRGNTTTNGGGGGGGGSGGNGGGSGGNNGGGGSVGGEKYMHDDSTVKEEGKTEQEKELGLGIATVPRPYEVRVVMLCVFVSILFALFGKGIIRILLTPLFALFLSLTGFRKSITRGEALNGR